MFAIIFRALSSIAIIVAVYQWSTLASVSLAILWALCEMSPYWVQMWFARKYK